MKVAIEDEMHTSCWSVNRNDLQPFESKCTSIEFATFQYNNVKIVQHLINCNIPIFVRYVTLENIDFRFHQNYFTVL